MWPLLRKQPVKTTKWSFIGSFMRSHSVLAIMTLLAGFAYNISTIIIPISIGKFYEFSFGFSSHRLKAFGFIPYMDATDHTGFFLLFFSLVGLRFAFEYVNRFGIAWFGERFAKSLREQLFAAQLQIAMPIYNKKGIGKYLLRFSGDLKSIQNYLKNGVLRFVQDVLLLVIVFLVIALLNMTLAGLILGFVLLATIMLWLLNKVLYLQSLERRNRKSGMLSFVNTRLRAVASIKAFNKYNPENKRYRKRSEQLYIIGKKYSGTVALLQASIPAITYGLLGITMAFVLRRPDYQNSIGGGSLLVVILLILAILPVLRRTLKVSIVWKLGSISFQKLINILESPKENELTLEAPSLKNSSLRFENIKFHYDDGIEPVFGNLNLEILPRTTTLLYGPSGCGKSTLIKLLLKSVSPKNGQLKFGKIPYSELSEKTIRKHIAVVSNDYPLYGKDVYEAIVYSRNAKRKSRASKLLQKLQQHENPKDQLQLHNRIGDLGCNLNAGQTKLLMYCRSLLTEKPILILEEPFECLNPKTSRLVLDILRDLQHKKTIIVLSQSEEHNLYFNKKHWLGSSCSSFGSQSDLEIS
ncbi:MAG: ABC transporter ATP-binding protein [Bacteroidota bacterium]